MTTVMTWSNSHGVKGRCDARCHNARSPASACKCMCGGRYHGTVRQGTFQQVRDQHGPDILEAAKAHAQRRGYELHTLDLQPTLFSP